MSLYGLFVYSSRVMHDLIFCGCWLSMSWNKLMSRY